MHVSVISIASFLGRLLTGIGSDILVRHRHSRFWCITASSSLFTVAQICALRLQNPQWLWVVSMLTGLAYGALFGVFPSLVADNFGFKGMSLNWGYMIISVVVFGYVFNLSYGRIYDSHSVVSPGEGHECLEGLACYASAYWITFAASVLCIGISLWSIKTESVKKRRRFRIDQGDGSA